MFLFFQLQFDYNSIDKSDILNIHKYLMKNIHKYLMKNDNIKQCSACLLF